MHLRFSLRNLLCITALVSFLLAAFFHLMNLDAPNLLDAAYKGDVSRVNSLLSAGASVRERDGWNGTALMYAAAEGHLEIVKKLLDAGASVDERSRRNDH